MASIDSRKEWAVAPAPGAAGAATVATNAAEAADRHVLTAFIFSVIVTVALAAGVIAECTVSDGATVIARGFIALPNGAAVGQAFQFALSGLNIPGTKNTAMVAQINAGVGIASVQQGVTLIGYDETTP